MSGMRAPRVAADGRRPGFWTERTIARLQRASRTSGGQAGGDTSALPGRNVGAPAGPPLVAADVRRLKGHGRDAHATWHGRPARGFGPITKERRR